MMCSCGKRKGTCNCKGYADGTPHTMGSLAKEIVPTALKIVSPLAGKESTTIKIGAPKNVTSKAQKEYEEAKGYAYGTKKMSPMGYYMGDAEVATPQQEQEMMAMAAPQVMQAPAVDTSPSETTQTVSDTASAAVTKGVEDEIGGAITEKITGHATEKVAEDALKKAGKAGLMAGAKEGAKQGLATGLTGAVGSAAGSLVGDVVSGKGITKEGAGKALMQAGLTAALGPVGGFIGGLFAKDGTPAVPPMGYAGGIESIPEGYADGTAKMTPEEYQMKFIKERILDPAEAYVEERPMLQAPLLLAAAARDYERGELPLGKFKGGKLEGGKDRIAYRHKKYGDFEINPESERVSYKKTFRF